MSFGKCETSGVGSFTLRCLSGYSGDGPFFVFIDRLRPRRRGSRHEFRKCGSAMSGCGTCPVPSSLAFLGKSCRRVCPSCVSTVGELSCGFNELIGGLGRLNVCRSAILVCSDSRNYRFGAHGLRCGHDYRSDDVRAPLVVGNNKFGNKEVRGELIDLVSVPPALLSLTRVPVPDRCTKFSLAGRVRGGGRTHGYIFVRVDRDRYNETVEAPGCVCSIHSVHPNNTLETDDGICFRSCLCSLRGSPGRGAGLVGDPRCTRVERSLGCVLVSRVGTTNRRRPIVLPTL